MKNQPNCWQQSPLKNSVLKFALFFFFISPLALSKKINKAGMIDRGSAAPHFAAAKGNHFFERQKKNVAPGIDKLKQSDWYSTAIKNMEESEYHFNKVGNTSSYSTPNRKSNLRFYYDENGFSVEPRTTKIPIDNGDSRQSHRQDEIKYETLPDWKVAFLLDKKQVGRGAWEINGSKAEYKTDNVTVEYINGEQGMRQNFIVQKPLSPDKDLKLNFSVKTKLKQCFSSNRLQFIHTESGTVLNYEDLKVWDANGKILDAAFEKNNNDYCIHVNMINAVYPITIDPISTTAAAMVESNQANGQLGSSVSSAGDVNGDGYSDVIVGAYAYDNGEAFEGAAFIYHGSATGISTTAAAMVQSNQVNANMGSSVSSTGDVNGDGYSDVIVGAQGRDNGQTDEGAAFIYHGSATGINTTAAAMVESNQLFANMGSSVAGAGDVNGDGYSDVIAGAYAYDNGQDAEGAAFIYHGSAAGINTTAASIVESNQASAFMGQGKSIAGAGDVNGDGYSDVIAGAYAYDNGQDAEGAAFIYHGSATGINAVPAAIVQSNQANAFLGYSVSSAGDVNGDGYSDVIVGSYFYDNGETNEGAGFIYHGSATGINTTAAARVESNQAGGQMGYSVAGAGDINGDGYSDVIVGAPYYDNGQNDEGTAFIYHGSATGISTTAAAMVESNQTFASMGISVAGAGDVNGDGYSDVIVGAFLYGNGEISEGAAFIYQGSPAGINTSAAAMVESNQADAFMGYSVSGAGDVNGDGYSDVIVGAYLYDNGETNEGAAFVFHGNAAANNKRNNLRLYNVNLTSPVSSSNFGLTNFGAGLFAKSFLGRGKGKLVWETRLNYNPYSGTPITNSALYTSQQSSYSNLGLTGTELKNLVAKQSGRYTKIRARIKYDPVTAITGQLYGPWRYVPEQIAGQSLGVLPVDLISFKVAWQQKGQTARIEFTTDNETAICCYEIEKSNDGFNFNRIGQLAATNTSALYTYHFIDNNATGQKQYYRLKAIHQDGAIDYSNIQLLQNNTTTEILVFPNPTTDILQLQLNRAYDNMKVQVVNSAGQVVKQVSASGTNQTIKIPVSGLASGVYFLYLQSGEEKQVLQFVKE